MVIKKVNVILGFRNYSIVFSLLFFRVLFKFVLIKEFGLIGLFSDKLKYRGLKWLV